MSNEKFIEDVKSAWAEVFPNEVVVRNVKTGTYHKGWTNAAVVKCSSGRARFSLRVVKDEEVVGAKDYFFCEKCFPEGKPKV